MAKLTSLNVLEIKFLVFVHDLALTQNDQSKHDL